MIEWVSRAVIPKRGATAHMEAVIEKCSHVLLERVPQIVILSLKVNKGA